ncbi:MAG TPA: VanZ family protein [Bacteroidia bacterium]|jgi:glycopeptide antibiotics resistance protein
MFLKHTKWAMLWALLILILCGIPGRDIPHISFLELLSFDKFVHAGIFFVLIQLTIRGFLLQTRFKRFQKFAKISAFVLCAMYGGALEIMQATVFEGRSADIYDFIANSFGCVMGWLLYNKIEKTVLARITK